MIYTVCHSFYIFWRHYFIVKLNCFMFGITTVSGLGVPIFRVFTVVPSQCLSRKVFQFVPVLLSFLVLRVGLGFDCISSWTAPIVLL